MVRGAGFEPDTDAHKYKHPAMLTHTELREIAEVVSSWRMLGSEIRLGILTAVRRVSRNRANQ